MNQAALFRPEAIRLAPRYYQEECVAALFAGFEAKEEAQLVTMATGLGKTVCFAELIRRFDGNVLVLAHRDELIQQAVRHCGAATGEQIEIEKAGDWSFKGRIVVGSVQSLRMKNRLERLGKDRFQLVIIDEAHHAIAPSYRVIMDYFDCPIVGFTATPDRGDETALGRIFTRVAYLMDIQEGIEQGWLVPFEGRRVVLDDIELDQIDKIAGDLPASQLDEAMVKSVKGVVAESMRLCPDRQSIAFFPGVRTAELATKEFNALRSDMACFISGDTPPEERQQTVADFRRGRYQILSNCMIATEGFDVPDVSMIIMGRPTLSRALYAQMMGRGGRPKPGIFQDAMTLEHAAVRQALILRSAKPNCMVIDCVGNSARHSLIGPADVLGGNFTEETVKLAKEKAKGGGDLLQALKDAQAELKRIAQVKVKVKATVTRFDPFEALGMAADHEDRYATRYGHKPATEPQRDLLLKRGMTKAEVDGLSKSDASRALDAMSVRMTQGKATLKQIRLLSNFGVLGARDASFERASDGINYIAGKGWNRGAVNPTELVSIVLGARQSGED